MKRILLVEDEKEISLMVKNYLTKEGYIVDTAFNGEEGLFQFRQKDYSLVILDIKMCIRDRNNTQKCKIDC